MKRMGAVLWLGTIIVAVATIGGCPEQTAPVIARFAINEGVETTAMRTVRLVSTCAGAPASYMASENADFAGAAWADYAPAPLFEFSAGNGTKTLYYKVSNSLGESEPVVETITLDEPELGPEAGAEAVFQGITFVWCPPGTFMMGRRPWEQDSDFAEDAQHQVTLTDGFWLSKYECTQAQWRAAIGANPSYFQGANADVGNTDDRPVERVSRVDIQTYAAFLNTAQGPSDLIFRLPTEAEWEYACRASNTFDSSRFYWGDDPAYSEIENHAWYALSSYGQTHDVGRKVPNAWGLHDMSGNVWEWVHDVWRSPYSAGAATDPTGPATGSYCVVRGGCWYSQDTHCRSAYRAYSAVTSRYSLLGFRLARGKAL